MRGRILPLLEQHYTTHYTHPSPHTYGTHRISPPSSSIESTRLSHQLSNVSSTKARGVLSLEKVLQQCCKCFEKLFSVCNTVASLTKNFSAFATPLQVSRKTFWRLQHCCKSHEKLSGVCNTVASLTKNFLVFATPLQVPRKTFWRLQHCCKRFQKRFGHRVTSVETLCRLYSYIKLTN